MNVIEHHRVLGALNQPANGLIASIEPDWVLATAIRKHPQQVCVVPSPCVTSGCIPCTVVDWRPTVPQSNVLWTSRQGRVCAEPPREAKNHVGRQARRVHQMTPKRLAHAYLPRLFAVVVVSLWTLGGLGFLAWRW